ncbi:MAG TPA: 3-deoxy-7-phosphoheptulonate synthase class II [Candidatus Hydrogenedentes bacterium]|nr:3-deoxy-7-phosphoheptulonate synthase class II [Candidatus Hydrogenedentota bacterium]
MTHWHPGSWRTYPLYQYPPYDDPMGVQRVTENLRGYPPLVAPGEVELLTEALAEAAAGRRFLLQGGDCAERFSDCTAASITARLQVLLQMSLVLTYATRKPVIRVGRMAGQYAKPRSADTETVNGQVLPAYRGDLVNDVGTDPVSRRPDPERMRWGYHHAAVTLNYIRALIEGGFADLHHPEKWDLGFIENSPHREAYRRIVDAITDAVTFMETIGGGGETLRRVSFYTSHEALLLPYEEALTRQDESGRWFNLGAHFLWVGYRTADPYGAHVHYLSGIANPVGIKVGPDTRPDFFRKLLEKLNPSRLSGRLTVISRYGAESVGEGLPALIETARADGQPVLWCCDPMHGNTRTTAAGRKTRMLSDIFRELEQTFEIHAACGSVLGGVHFELTGSAVTECLGGSSGITEQDLRTFYETACDPRLNAEQSLEMAFLIARLLRQDHAPN